MEINALAWWKNAAQIAAFIFAGLAALAAGFVWFTGRELDRRRAADEDALRNRVTASQLAADAARRDADALRQRFAPRVLTPEQRALIIARLRGAKGTVDVLYLDQESQSYAKQLEAALSAAGLTVKLEGALSFGPVVGLSVKVRSLEKVPPTAKAVQAALESALGSVPIRANQNLAEGAVELTVGSKPTEQ